ncbi:MAG TPA: glycosyltransferase family 39 protein, partial [Anaerolineales bacterium]
ALLALAAILLAAGLRFVALEADFPAGLDWSADLYTDEGWYSGNASAWAITGQWYIPGDFNSAINLPVFPLFQAASFRLLGVSLASARLTEALFSLALLGLAYALARRLAGPLTAILAALLLSTSFTLFAFSRLALLEIPLTVFVLASLLLALSTRRRPLALGFSAACFAAAVLTKTTALPLLPALLYAAWCGASDANGQTRDKLASVLAVLAGATGLLLAYNVLAYIRFPVDYVYFNTANVTPRGEWTPFFVLQAAARILYNGLVLDKLMYPLALGLLPIFLLAFRSFRRDRLVILAIVWFAGYAGYLAIRGYLPPRYYLPLAVPVALVFSRMVGFGSEWLRRGRRQVAWLPLAAAAGIAALNLAAIFGYLSAPRYTFRDLGRDLARRAAQSPIPGGGRPTLLGNLANTLSISSGLPSINTELGPKGLAWKVQRYQPEYFVSLGEEKDVLNRLGAFYQVQELAIYDVFDNYIRGKQVHLYRLLAPAGG